MVFHPREEGLEYGLEHAVIGGEDVFLVLHNHTGADFEIGRRPDRRHTAGRVAAARPLRPSGCASRTSRRTPGTSSCPSAAAA